MKRTTLKILKDNVGGLSAPSKMPWYGWSIPASMCKTGGKLRKKAGSVCHKCYAFRGHYNYPTVQNALTNRRDLWKADPKEWVDNMVEAINRQAERTPAENRYFRWFDSGDLQSVGMLQNINDICHRTPAVTHYLPTKEYGFIAQFRGRIESGKVKLAPNLVIRVSGHMVDKPFPETYQGFPTSVVETERRDESCPAYKQDGKCGDCRACWDPGVPQIPYPVH